MGSPEKGKEMAKNLVLSGQNFEKLVLDLRKIIDAGRARAQAAANQALMETYWRCGARIARERLTGNSGYGESVMERLANELHADRTTLVRCVLYHQYYPKGVSQNIELTWSHMRELLTVKNDKAREFYETTAIEKKWTRDELVKAIQADHFGEDPTKGNGKPPKQLKRPAGEPFIYRALCYA